MQTFTGTGPTLSDFILYTAPFDGWYSLRVQLRRISGSNAVHVNVGGALYSANTPDAAIQASVVGARNVQSQAVDAFVPAGATVSAQILGSGQWQLIASVERLGDDI
jgi:hypothetical protein